MPFIAISAVWPAIRNNSTPSTPIIDHVLSLNAYDSRHAMTPPALPVPFFMLCGSLGAGKTTLLVRLLEYWNAQGERVGVLMNEAGEVSIDGPRVGMIAEQVLNLAGGCVCCDTKDDLAWGIAQLIQDHQSTLIILECSGMADPAEVVDAVTDAYVSRLVRLERIFALLHPVALPDTGLAEVVTHHAIRYADDLILNKRDLYIPGHWEQFRAAIVHHNPYGRVWETTHARVDPSRLLETRPHHPRKNMAPAHLVQPDSMHAAVGDRALHHPMVMTVRLNSPVNKTRFLSWIEQLPQGIERAKGFFRFADEPELQEFQFFTPRTSTITPVMLLDEPEHAMVLIGRNYDQDRCRAELIGCLEADRNRTL